MSTVKSTELFKKVIQQKMEERAQEDELFARNFYRADKNIDDCITYVLNQVKQSKLMGLTDEEVFGLAAHYYDETDIKVGTPVQCRIITNHAVELSEEEIRDAKKDAKAEIQHYETIRLKQEAEKEFKAEIIKEQRDKLSPEEISEAQREAKQQVIEEERKRLTSKKPKARMTIVKSSKDVVATQNSLF